MFIYLSKKKLLAAALLTAVLVSGGMLLTRQQSSSSVLSWHIADKTYIVDPGHGGIFPGKVSPEGVKEKDINLAIARQLNNFLAESGAKVAMTRTEDSDLVPAEFAESKMILRQRADLGQRTDMAQTQQADLFISIHCNSIPSAKWQGAQTFFAPDSPESARLAQCIQQSLIKQLQNTDRQALVRNDTFLFRNLTIPAVIVECGFLSNPDEAARLQDPAYQQKIAHAIYLGISDYLAEDTAQPTG